MKWIGKLREALGASATRREREIRDTPVADTRAPDERIAGLTPREGEVFALLIQGMKRREVAARLSVSEATVSFHTQSLYRKLGIHDRAQLLLRYAIPGRTGTEKQDEGDTV